jgi:hypothetical protein
MLPIWFRSCVEASGDRWWSIESPLRCLLLVSGIASKLGISIFDVMLLRSLLSP